MTPITESHERSMQAKVAIAQDALSRFIEVVDSMDESGLCGLENQLNNLMEDSADEHEEALVHAALKYIAYVKTVNIGDDSDD